MDGHLPYTAKRYSQKMACMVFAILFEWSLFFSTLKNLKKVTLQRPIKLSCQNVVQCCRKRAAHHDSIISNSWGSLCNIIFQIRKLRVSNPKKLLIFICHDSRYSSRNLILMIRSYRGNARSIVLFDISLEAMLMPYQIY